MLEKDDDDFDEIQHEEKEPQRNSFKHRDSIVDKESDRELMGEETEESNIEVGLNEAEEEIEKVNGEQLPGISSTKPKRIRARRGKSVMEYDLKDMYPEIGLLTENTKREWNYHNPEIIRAIWLESKTNVLYEWKIKYGKIKQKSKPTIEVRDTNATNIRREYRKLKEEKRLKDEEKTFAQRNRMRSPNFKAVEIVSNATTDMRLKYNKNDPNVPKYYVEHFQKYKKPPFRVMRYTCKR
ncbi:hypothetical protein PGB90_003276 [Kerria lacca]